MGGAVRDGGTKGTNWWDYWSTESLPSPKLGLPQPLRLHKPSHCLSSLSQSELSCHWMLRGRLTHLRVVSIPPHVSEGAHLARPQHCSCVDLFVLRGDKGKRQVYMLQGTWGTREETRHRGGGAFSALPSLLWIYISSGSLQNITVPLPEESARGVPWFGEGCIVTHSLYLSIFHLLVFLPGVKPELFLCKTWEIYKWCMKSLQEGVRYETS